MEYLEPSYHHLHDPMAQVITPYSEAHRQHLQHSYAMAQQTSTMITMPNHHAKVNETKPRLGKEEVDVLEREFTKNSKPSTQTKRAFAEEMGVELARINNWFQNRRAKRKQEKKQEAYEAGQTQESSSYSEPSSPDNFYGSSYFSESNLLPLHNTDTFPIGGPPPPPVASYNPQYSDPSSASMESLQRTMAAAQAASQQQDFIGQFQDGHEPMRNFDEQLLHATISDDRAQFPTHENVAPFEENHVFSSYDIKFRDDLYSSPDQRLAENHHSQIANQITTPFHNYSAPSGDNSTASHVLASFPSQLLLLQAQDRLPTQPQEHNESDSPEESTSSVPSIDFKYDVAESDSLPEPTLSFKSPPPTDLASRRKKAVKPAALTADTLRGRPSLGPRTVSHADGFRLPSDSPMSTPMRRIVSAGGNRSVVSGRVGKVGVESAQRSPININGFSDARSFMDHNYHTTRQPPSLTAASSLNNSLAPPTPMSPREREMTFLKPDGSGSTASPVENSMNFVFNTGVPGSFTPLEDQNLASPPETPQAHIGILSLNNGWPTTADFPDKQWHFEVPDEPLYTPGQETFPMELHMPQPSYLSPLSQPVTPAFGQFNSTFVFGSESPHYKIESPQYQLSSQSHAEYFFPDSHYPGGTPLTSPISKQKTFQFSNTTAADFSEK